MGLGRTLGLAAIGLAALGAASAAQAQTEGFYIGLGGGLALPEDSEIDTNGATVGIDLDNGPAGFLFGGYEFSSGLRAELEFGRRWHEVDSIGGTGGGDTDVTSVMLNGIYEHSGWGRLKPHLGFGIGVAGVDYETVSPVFGQTLNDSDTGLAFQGIAGLGYDVTERIQVSLGYRYLMVPDLDMQTAGGTQVSTDYKSHTVLAGLRFRFPAPKAAAAPEPKPAPAAAPAPAPKPEPMAKKPAPPPPPRNFLVFFDWDRANLTAEASRIVSEASAAARELGAVRIDATGHADRSGPAQYNVGLSKRRAETVKNELVRLGVPADSITVDWKGEAEPLVPTDDGVREPQNRRVEIILK